MINTFDRQEDILSIMSQLDISPTMYRNAVSKYRAIATYLGDCGIDADFFPQGSFALGTVVRPFAQDASANYDLDFIAQVIGSRDDHTPSELRNMIEGALSASGIYSDKLTVFEECFSIEYADVNGTGFTIDIVPATDESPEVKTQLAKLSPSPRLISSSIAIPKHNGERNYRWLTNNPKGYRAWFESINAPFLAAAREMSRKRLFESHRSIFGSIEEIPRELERSALQRVIQILKYHRNVYFAQRKDLKPNSAIINTVVARISERVDSSYSVFMLLEYVLEELEIYAKQQTLTMKEFETQYESRAVFSRPDGKWYIPNPANPKDNLADQWNVDARLSAAFFQWIKFAYKDLVTALHREDDTKFGIILENAFGRDAVSSTLGGKYRAAVAPKPVVAQTAAKPYGQTHGA